MQFVNHANRLYNIQVDPRGLFSFPILLDLAERIAHCSNRLYCASAIPVRRYGDKIPIFFLPDGLGDTSYAFELAHDIDINIPVYALPWSSPESEQPSSIEEMARAMILKIKNVQSNGPCAIAGYSSGGILAYEITKQLINSGYPVSFLGLIDTHPTKGLMWLLRVSNLSLNEAIEEVKAKNEDLTNEDIEWEALLSKQRAHYYNICDVYNIDSLPITVNLFKATELDLVIINANDENMYEILRNDFDKSFNHRKLRWEDFHLPSLHVIPVNGTHVTMLTDPNNRSLLGRKLTDLLLAQQT